MKIEWKPTEVYNKLSEKFESLNPNKTIVVYIASKFTKEMKSRYQEQFYYWILNEIAKQTDYSMETIKQYLLGRVFWKKEVFWELVNNKNRTSEFDIKEAREFIESLLIFIKEHSLSCKYQSRDIENLLLTYDKWKSE